MAFLLQKISRAECAGLIEASAMICMRSWRMKRFPALNARASLKLQRGADGDVQPNGFPALNARASLKLVALPKYTVLGQDDFPR